MTPVFLLKNLLKVVLPWNDWGNVCRYIGDILPSGCQDVWMSWHPDIVISWHPDFPDSRPSRVTIPFHLHSLPHNSSSSSPRRFSGDFKMISIDFRAHMSVISVGSLYRSLIKSGGCSDSHSLLDSLILHNLAATPTWGCGIEVRHWFGIVSNLAFRWNWF